jgi:hypothetical protein
VTAVEPQAVLQSLGSAGLPSPDLMVALVAGCNFAGSRPGRRGNGCRLASARAAMPSTEDAQEGAWAMPAEIQVFPTTALGDNTYLLPVGRNAALVDRSGTPGSC